MTDIISVNQLRNVQGAPKRTNENAAFEVRHAFYMNSVLILVSSVYIPFTDGIGRHNIMLRFPDPYRTASSTTGGWSRWYILMCFIILSTTVSHFWTLRMPFFFTKSPLFVYISFFFASTLCICVMYLTSI